MKLPYTIKSTDYDICINNAGISTDCHPYIEVFQLNKDDGEKNGLSFTCSIIKQRYAYAICPWWIEIYINGKALDLCYNFENKDNENPKLIRVYNNGIEKTKSEELMEYKTEANFYYKKARDIMKKVLESKEDLVRSCFGLGKTANII